MKHFLYAVLFIVAAASAQGQTFRDPFTDGTSRSGPVLIAIPVTEGVVGSRADEAGHTTMELRRRVTVSPYAIGQYEVTNAELCAFLNEAGNGTDESIPRIDLATAKEILFSANKFTPVAGTENHPAAGVTWRGARAYCGWLSKKTGASYELATAVQWELAARAGTATSWWWGDVDDPARQHSIAAGLAAPVDAGSHGANPWGIYDTAGNVWEWTLDCFVPDAPLLTTARDPLILDERCLTPEIRGGSYDDGREFSRPSYRANAWWSTHSPSLGFRVARRMQSKGTMPKPAAAGPQKSAPAPAKSAASIRIKGTITGAAAGSALTVRIGTGPRVAAMDRWSRASGSTVPADDRWATALGIALPPSPLNWRDARVDGTTFTIDAIAPDDQPQVVAFDAAGRVAVRDITIPAQTALGATIDAGAIALQPYASLEVDFPRPAGDVIAPMFFGVSSAQLDPAAIADAGRFLSVADVVDPRLFGLLVAGHGCGVDPGATVHLSPLPPFRSLTLLTHEPIGASSVPVLVSLGAGSTASVHLSVANEISFRSAPAVAFSGRVTMPFSGAPLVNAGIVVNDYPARRETTTDADGRFQVEGIRGDRPIDVLVDASKRSVPSPYAATQIFRAVDPAVEAALVMTPPVSATQGGAIPLITQPRGAADFKCTPVNDDQYSSFIGEHGSTSDLNVVGYAQNGFTVTMAACAADAEWIFWYAQSPFDLYTGTGAIQTQDSKPPAGKCPTACQTCYTGEITFAPVQPPLKKIVMTFNRTVFGRSIPAGSGTEVLFSAPGKFGADLDPTSILTNADSQIVLCNVSVGTVHIVVPGLFADYECDVNLGTVCTIDLSSKCSQAVQCQGNR